VSDTPGGAEAAAPKTSKVSLLLVLLNTVAVLGAVGVAVYTQILFKRPAITEDAERAKIAAAKASPAPPAVSGLIHFEAVTVNIKSTPTNPKPDDGTAEQIQGKLHYCTLGFSLEMRDMAHQGIIEALRPVIMDRMLSMLGRKNFQELTTVQGRYVLRTQLLDLANELLLKETGKKEVSVTNVFFNQFVVQ
jgi:flagellar basal body-associated protein FliL